MEKVNITIDGVRATVDKGTTVLLAADSIGIYIPRLCHHPDLSSSRDVKADESVYRGTELVKNDHSLEEFGGCQLCVVEIDGIEGLPTACTTVAAEGMVVKTNSAQLEQKRRDNLNNILVTHPHTCLICHEREGCGTTRCSQSVPENLRCCTKWGLCELQAVAKYIGVAEDIAPYLFQDLPKITEEPLFARNYNLCIGCTRCIRVCKEIRGVSALGFVFHDGKVIVGTKAPTLRESGCKFCGACVEVCPTGALMDKDVSLADREAMLVPCRNTCPAGVDVPRYVRLVAQGKFAEAAAVIREKVPFPGVLGHICLHFCEAKCRRGQISEPIAIRAVKRFGSEHDTGLWKRRTKVAPATGKRIAIVGSGPAGLTAAYYLAKLGHGVTIFEESPVPAGMMRLGIPGHRLPSEVVDREVKEITSIGVELKTNTKVGSLNDLLNQGYDAVLLAVGTHRGQKLPIPGAELDGVLVSIPFLRNVNLGKEMKIGKRVVVLGGGNVAFDCARTALRLGATRVDMACLEPQDKMLATPDELSRGKEEGIVVHNSQTFVRIAADDGRVTGVECLDVKSFEFDKEGRLHVESIAGSEHIIPADTVIFATGQSPELELVEGVNGVNITRRKTLEVDPNTLATGKAGIFAAGDMVTGTTSVIEAIAAGRRAATSIDRYLGGTGQIDEALVETDETSPYLGREEGFADRARVPMPCLPAEQSLSSLDEVELGFDETQAISEAKRCLQCDLRLNFSPVVLPPEKWLKFNIENIQSVPDTEGVFQLLDEQKMIIMIKGTQKLRQELESQLQTNKKCQYFIYEEDLMYTKRESELVQQFTQKYLRMPEQNAELDDLF